MSRVRIFVDMDDTICAYSEAHAQALNKCPDILFPQSQDGFFLSLKPIKGALEVLHWMESVPEFDVHILTAPSVKNPKCYTEKRLWVERHLGEAWTEKLHISRNKDFFVGDLLIDDSTTGRGQERFTGLLLPYGNNGLATWTVLKRFFQNALEHSKSSTMLSHTLFLNSIFKQLENVRMIDNSFPMRDQPEPQERESLD